MLIIDELGKIAFNTKFISKIWVSKIKEVFDDKEDVIGYAMYILASVSSDNHIDILGAYYMDKYEGAEDVLKKNVRAEFDDIMNDFSHGKKVHYTYSDEPALKHLKYSSRFHVSAFDFEFDFERATK